MYAGQLRPNVVSVATITIVNMKIVSGHGFSGSGEIIGALIDIRPEGADQDTLVADREKMLLYGTTIGIPIGELFRIANPDTVLGLWTAAEVAEYQE